MTAGSYSRRHRALEILALAAAAAHALVLLVRVTASAHPRWLPLAGTAAVLGYLAADLLSGLVHWIFDTWGDEDAPVIGRAFIAPFREHHRDPASITRHDFVETNGNSAIPVVPVLGAACLMPLDTGLGVLAAAFVLSTSLGVLATNQIHKWAHAEHVPPPVRLLQRAHLILPSHHHGRHHAPPYASHYCITTGWMNPLLSALDFHRGVERGVGALTGWGRKQAYAPDRAGSGSVKAKGPLCNPRKRFPGRGVGTPRQTTAMASGRAAEPRPGNLS